MADVKKRQEVRKFKYTNYSDKSTKIMSIPSMENMSVRDMEIPCSHPSPICIRSLTSPERRAKTASLRREFREQMTRSAMSDRSPSSCSWTNGNSQNDVKLPHIERGALSWSRQFYNRAITNNNAAEKEQQTKTKPTRQLDDFIRRHPSGMGVRPKFVFNIELKPVSLPDQPAQPTHRKTFFQNHRKGRARFHFIDPDWFSERETFVRNIDNDRMKYSWI